ncbi:MAG: nitronate monooxygenase [Trueperaceae bacterium]|nr:nitronate monooxygenase [Trueperaceae bacterium]
MGVAVSNWRLARAVASEGQIGVISGTGIDSVLVRRLQDGDPEGAVRRAMAAFPFPDIVKEALKRYFLPEGRQPGTTYKRSPMPSATGNRIQQGLTILGSYVEVFLAKEGHSGQVGINLLTKVQLPNLAALYGSMLAGVDYVLMGAGIPREVPGALDRLAQHLPASFRLDITELPGVTRDGPAPTTDLIPHDFGSEGQPDLKRPAFLPIVASHSLASMLQKKANGSIEGFVVEGPTAGGHNAPPRGAKVFDDEGQPVYGERDIVDLEKMVDLGLPFWLAGAYGSPEALRRARAHGAAGVQVGTLFAYCEESGLEPSIKDKVLEQVIGGTVSVRTDPRASPTGFPFKVVSLPGSTSEEDVYRARKRVCDLGYLREVYRKDDGGIGYRCASEPIADYMAKGGEAAETAGRKCLCNALMVNIGLGQIQKDGSAEAPLLTSGDDLPAIERLIRPGRSWYSARDVLDYLLDTTPIAAPKGEVVGQGA